LRVPEHEVAFILASGAVQGDERRRGRRRAAIRWPGATVDEIADSAATQYDVPKVNLEDYEIDPEVIALVPRAVVQRHAAIPVQRAGGFLIVAMADPANMAAIDDFKFITGLDVEPVVATATSIAKAIRRYYGSG
jgi:type IV pilus assembly protein PilB